MQRWIRAGRVLFTTLALPILFACSSAQEREAESHEDWPPCDLPPYDASVAAIESNVMFDRRRPTSLNIIDCKYQPEDVAEVRVLEACSFAIDPADVPNLARYPGHEKVRQVGTYLPPVVAELAKSLPQPLASIHHFPGTPEWSYLDADHRHGVIMKQNSRCLIIEEVS